MSSVIREMQIKSTRSERFIHIHIAKIKRLTKLNVGGNVEQQELLYTAGISYLLLHNIITTNLAAYNNTC